MVLHLDRDGLDMFLHVLVYSRACEEQRGICLLALAYACCDVPRETHSLWALVLHTFIAGGDLSFQSLAGMKQ